MNENEEIIEEIEETVSVSSNDIEVPVDAHVDTLAVTVENNADNEQIVSLLEDIKLTLQNVENGLTTVSENDIDTYGDDLEVEVVESNPLINKPLDHYTITEALATLGFLGILFFGLVKLYFHSNVR